MVTTSRADYGIYRPVLRQLCAEPELELRLVVTGTHLSAAHGTTVREIEADGFSVSARVPMPMASDGPAEWALAMGAVTSGCGRIFSDLSPDVVLVLGDRLEMHAAAVATVPFNLPLAHLHGGEVTEGALDDVFRHSLTKLSHLHFVATERYRQRVLQLGEEPWRVTVSGAPGLDELPQPTPASLAALAARVALPLAHRGFLLVTFHPATREPGAALDQVACLVGALDQTALPVLITMPNADPGGSAIRAAWRDALATRSSWRAVENLGGQLYGAAMGHAAAMVGNSSSGLIEAPSLGLPVVNIGTRQAGRVRGANVIDVECTTAAIGAGLRHALADAFRAAIAGAPNPYGDGQAAARIVAVLREVELGQSLLKKRFVDWREV